MTQQDVVDSTEGTRKKEITFRSDNDQPEDRPGDSD